MRVSTRQTARPTVVRHQAAARLSRHGYQNVTFQNLAINAYLLNWRNVRGNPRKLGNKTAINPDPRILGGSTSAIVENMYRSTEKNFTMERRHWSRCNIAMSPRVNMPRRHMRAAVVYSLVVEPPFKLGAAEHFPIDPSVVRAATQAGLGNDVLKQLYHFAVQNPS